MKYFWELSVVSGEKKLQSVGFYLFSPNFPGAKLFLQNFQVRKELLSRINQIYY
jgi:hypothetical protein